MARVSEAKEKTEVGTYLHCHCLKYVSCGHVRAAKGLPYIFLKKATQLS